MQVDIFDCSSQKLLVTLEKVGSNEKISRIKERIAEKKKNLYVERQSLRSDSKGKNIGDDETVASLKLPQVGARLYLKDLGTQIAWKTVFLLEYMGPLLIYPIFYLRPYLIYGDVAAPEPTPMVVHIACVCYSVHFSKRVLETLFIHRFSKATMPIFNLFKNSSYYWGFAAFIAYFINHPLYTPPCLGFVQVGVGLTGFILSEMGNFSTHVAFRNLRPEGSKERKIPMPTGDPFTKLFDFVSCPNYTYEVAAWLSFSIMTQSLPALIFTAAGFYQMAVWAIGKHKAYKKEFSAYPKNRKAIVPFVL